ncbi:MAG: DegV family protein [Cellulosilyticaceae bacterium]
MIKILSDSSSLYTKQSALDNGLAISPLIVTINGKSYMEYEDIDAQTFVNLINEGHIPTSSQPSIGDVVDLYNQFSDSEIINITMADGLSGTYNSACSAKTMVEHPDKIHVINSKTLCGPHRYIVDLACNLSKSGKSVSEIIPVLEEATNNTKSYLIPNDFDYLVRGGRLSPLVGKIGSLIKLVPVTVLSEDAKTLEKFTTTRGFKKAIQKIAQAMVNDGVNENYKVYVAHALNETLALEAQKILEELVPGITAEVLVLGPAFITQGGPGCIAIQWIKK